MKFTNSLCASATAALVAVSAIQHKAHGRLVGLNADMQQRDLKHHQEGKHHEHEDKKHHKSEEKVHHHKGHESHEEGKMDEHKHHHHHHHHDASHHNKDQNHHDDPKHHHHHDSNPEEHHHHHHQHRHGDDNDAVEFKATGQEKRNQKENDHDKHHKENDDHHHHHHTHSNEKKHEHKNKKKHHHKRDKKVKAVKRNSTDSKHKHYKKHNEKHHHHHYENNLVENAIPHTMKLECSCQSQWTADACEKWADGTTKMSWEEEKCSQECCVQFFMKEKDEKTGNIKLKGAQDMNDLQEKVSHYELILQEEDSALPNVAENLRSRSREPSA